MRIFFFLVCCHLTLGSGAAGEPRPDKASRRDVFLITIDTLRADHVHCYGYDRVQTPSLDQLAKQGVRFTQAFTPSPITNSSHASILTGLLPSAHGVSDFGVPLAASHLTLAETLKKRGYRTAAFIGAVILDSKALAPGLDRGFEFYDNFPAQSETKSRWGRVERRGMEVVQHAETWLNAHPAGPHFVWVHLYDPHDPYEPPPPYSEIYKDEDTHGIFLYDSTTHVPLLVKLPEQREAGRTVEAQVRTTDIMPSILEVLGVLAPARLDGESLGPFLTGTGAAPRTVFGETDYPLRFGWAPLRSVRKEGLKFIEAPKPELYDLPSDPNELQNHYVPWDPRVQKLRKILAELSTKSPAPAKTSPATVSAGTIDELHALGYLGSADAGSATDVPEPSLLPDPKDKIEEQNLLHTAMMASEDGETDKARAALEKVLQLDDRSVLALSQLGRLEMSSGNYAKAAGYLRRAHAARPDDAAAAFEYGRALELSGDLPGARDALHASLKLNPNQFAARLSLGRVYLSLNDLKEAEDQLEAAVLTQPGSVEAQIGLAKALIRQKKFADAVELLEPIAGASSSGPEMFQLLSDAYAGLGRRQEAERAASRAKALQKSKRPQ